MEETYIIIKTIEQKGKKPNLNVIILDWDATVLEISGLDKANKMRDLFQLNSDSGHTYEIKKIGN